MTDKIEVLIYNGYDAGPNGVKNTKEALNTDEFSVKTAATLSSITLTGKQVLILGGGDSGWAYINNKNISWTAIREFIKNGGGLVATCAGAYAASKNVVDINGKSYYSESQPQGLAPHVISRVMEEPLGSIPFVFVGPECRQIGKEPIQQNMLHWRGPAMMPVSETESPIIFALYDLKSDKNSYNLAGVIGDTYGDGKVILSGPHPELDPKDPALVRNMVRWAAKKGGSNMIDSNNMDNTNIRIVKSDFKLMITAVENYQGTPNKVYIRTNGVKQSTYFTKSKFDTIKARWDAFKIKEGREPNYIDTNPATNTTGYVRIPPYDYFFQQTDFWCGPTSLETVLSTYNIYPSPDVYTAQKILAEIMGTHMDYSGTSHNGMIQGANHYILKAQFVSFSRTGIQGIADKIKDGCRVIVNIMTGDEIDGGWRFPGYSGSFGHYIVIVGVNPDTGDVVIADPDRNVKTVSWNTMLKATSLISSPSLMLIWK